MDQIRRDAKKGGGGPQRGREGGAIWWPIGDGGLVLDVGERKEKRKQKTTMEG